ncbi:MAG: hypothetical protein OIF38_01785 [Cellvibrionaceae bacterium]|nr:hypothetical protein [Cellvibrionaceae bacterium]
MDHLPFESPDLATIPLADQHFSLLCLAIEKAYGLHMGNSGRLLLDFKLSPGLETAHLPRIRPLNCNSYIIDESYLSPTDVFLYYDPEKSGDLPLLASYDSDSHRFIAVSRRMIESQNVLNSDVIVPISRLSSLRGLHYAKDCICLQMMKIDFDRLYQAKPALAEQLRQALWAKYNRFYNFDDIAERSSDYEAAAKKYLEAP